MFDKNETDKLLFDQNVSGSIQLREITMSIPRKDF